MTDLSVGLNKQAVAFGTKLPDEETKVIPRPKILDNVDDTFTLSQPANSKINCNVLDPDKKVIRIIRKKPRPTIPDNVDNTFTLSQPANSKINCNVLDPDKK